MNSTCGCSSFIITRRRRRWRWKAAQGIPYFWRYSCDGLLRRPSLRGHKECVDRNRAPRSSPSSSPKLHVPHGLVRPTRTLNCLHIFRVTCSCLPWLTPEAPRHNIARRSPPSFATAVIYVVQFPLIQI